MYTRSIEGTESHLTNWQLPDFLLITAPLSTEAVQHLDACFQRFVTEVMNLRQCVDEVYDRIITAVVAWYTSSAF